uniref:Small ribosomal subunit protein uS2c n=1 Tax=Monomastix sp. (strain OKE-1) TaxID=141716 RepID=C0JWL4_MONSK|nr:ribosomal protein S2 [Monomastix sp. OKE-1]ACK36879.1 ribosomal protein S2 [Monomastix sp. OKE-1]
MIPIEELLEAGVHFGHRVNKWNPKMAPYIFGERNGVHIIDIIQTLGYLEESYLFLSKYTVKGALRNSSSPSNPKTFGEGIGQKVLFVGTKKQVASIVQAEAENSHANYVNHRWLGGLLTNWSTIKLCIAKLKTLRASGLFENTEISSVNNSTKTSLVTTKKEKALLKKQYEKLKKFFSGIENMSDIPDIVIIVGQDCEMNAVKECQKLASSWRSDTNSTKGGNALPRTITILDTNCDPSLADLFIPANDDSTKSVELILKKLGEAIRIPR